MHFSRRARLALATAVVTAATVVHPVSAVAETPASKPGSSSGAWETTRQHYPDLEEKACKPIKENETAKRELKENIAKEKEEKTKEIKGETNDESLAKERIKKALGEIDKKYESDLEKIEKASTQEFTVTEKGKKEPQTLTYPTAKAYCDNTSLAWWTTATPEFQKGPGIFNAVLAVLGTIAVAVGLIVRINPNAAKDAQNFVNGITKQLGL
ncbi:hypothetical protein CATYP_07195 [Corynebacterium atypicum]|uniref:Secreted protein n=1 Tax=Corynebacterium atypicum TaxID=191610 RepID=A0ABN4DGR3_9CORY|nr:hypothetical protein [Corynebacterium atypicum]AIG64407.1 hypothetical protein CATYP_07195 [Corynebacterium atypicum]